MADEEAQMMAMMQQMQAAGGSAAGGGAIDMMSNNQQIRPTHNKRQSNLSLSQVMQPKVDPLQEIEDYRAEKDLLLSAYDKIDLDDNGDIEFNEFQEGMHRLNVSLTDEEIEQVFKLMDSDASEYVDRTEFTMFLTQRFESTELTRFQDAILRKLGGRTRKSISGAITHDAAEDIEDTALAAMAREMRKEMSNLGNQEMQIIKEEEELYSQLQQCEEEKADNFGKKDKAAEWNRFEVAHWIDAEVGLNEYMTNFMRCHVDGSILLSDLSRDFLVMEIGVKRVHVEKIMRAIQELRDVIRKEWDESECFDVIPYPILNDERALDKIEELKGEISKRDEEIENLRKEYESRIEALCKKIAEKEEVIAQAEKDGFIMNDADGKEDESDIDAQSVDSADIRSDEDMPPLIDANNQMVLEPAMQTAAEPEAPQEAPADAEQEQEAEQEHESKEDEEQFEIIEPKANEDGSNNGQQEQTETAPYIENGGANSDVANGDLMVVSHPSSPNLTPSASQLQLQKGKSFGSVSSLDRKRKHHRKNSTKTGFWNSAPNKKKPPVGTKAYWLFLDQKRETQPNFADPLRVRLWHHHEIAYWLKFIKCEKYAVKFVEERVNGEQLIHDMSTTVLSTDLGVKMLHCGKIMREIKTLKIQAGLQYVVDEKTTAHSYQPSDEESVTKQLEEASNKLKEAEGKHEEEMKEQQTKYDELKEENDELKQENKKLEEQVTELKKRKARPVDDDDTDEEEYDEQAQAQPMMDSIAEETTEETKGDEEVKQDADADANADADGDGDGDADGGDDAETPSAAAVTLDIPTDKVAVKSSSTEKRPKGYFRKYPKEIRKLMREIDDMERRSNAGDFGEKNKGKFAAPHRAYKWKTQEVCSWLDQNGFIGYIKSFHDNGIDGEILINDLNPTILHEDLHVKRFHVGKLLREIQVLRQGGLFTEDECVIDIQYEPQFSAKAEIEKLQAENQEMAAKIQESEEKVSELINRPQIEEHQKIVEIAEWEALNSEKERLAKQVDEYEEKIEDIQHSVIPEQEKAEKLERLQQFIAELEQQKQDNEEFGNVIKVRQWSTDEVCWFFSSINLGDYIEGIRESKINGEILIEDSSPEMLARDVGVKRIHINQVMRQVEDLRHKAFGYEADENVIDIAFVPEVYATELHAEYDKKIEGLEQQITEHEHRYSELNTLHETLGKEKQDLIAEKDGLLQNIEELKQQIQALKDQQQQEMEESAKSKIEELETQIEALNTTITDNQGKYEEEKKQIEDENQKVVEEKDGNINALNSKVEELENSLNEASSTIRDYEEKDRIAREEEEAKDNSYEAQLRRKAENDATFAVPKLAHKWTLEEVSHWLYTIKIPDYVNSFKEKLVDGSILLSDLSPEQLRTELGIKQYHIGKITREIQKLKELATPPLSESDIVCDSGYIPDKAATEVITELNQEIADQKDINSALNIEVTRLQQKLQTMEEIVSISKEDQDRVTAGGPSDAESKDNLTEPDELLDHSGAAHANSHAVNSEEIEKLTKENRELNEMLEYLQKSKIDLAMSTAKEMQSLRAMVRVASKAYEELTGTPLGQVAQWPSTQNFFYNTLGYDANKKNDPSNNNNRRHYR